jgi:hypothetical protein
MKSDGIAEDRLDGAAPPWGSYRSTYSSYELEQFSQIGSGLLGGRSYASNGGFFTAPAVEAELREELAHSRYRPPWALASAPPKRRLTRGR